MKQYLEIDISALSVGAKQKLMNTYRNIHVYGMDLMGISEHYIIIEVDVANNGHNLHNTQVIREVVLSDTVFEKTVGEIFKKKYPDFQEPPA